MLKKILNVIINILIVYGSIILAETLVYIFFQKNSGADSAEIAAAYTFYLWLGGTTLIVVIYLFSFIEKKITSNRILLFFCGFLSLFYYLLFINPYSYLTKFLPLWIGQFIFLVIYVGLFIYMIKGIYWLKDKSKGFPFHNV